MMGTRTFLMVNPRRIARTMSVLLLLFWGSFFVEHLSWFASVPSKVPSATVWLLSVLHLTLLVSYALSLRWERTGSVGIILCSILFFSLTAGYNALPFIIVSISPAMVFFYIWKKERGKTFEEHSNEQAM